MAHEAAVEQATDDPTVETEKSVVLASLVAGLLAVVVLLASAWSSAPQPHLEARGPDGAVATDAAEASEAALEVLKRGGNAFDALVAASFVVSVAVNVLIQLSPPADARHMRHPAP